MTDGTPVTKNLEENEVWFRSRCEGCSDIKLQPMRLGKDGSCLCACHLCGKYRTESDPGRIGAWTDVYRHGGKDPKEVYQAVEANSLGLSEAQPLQTREEGMNAMLAGNLLLLVEGYDKGLKIGSKGYPARSVANTDTEKVLRGSKRRIYRVGKNQYSTDPKKNPEYRYESRRADRRCPVKYKAGTGIYERAGISGSAGTDPAGH